MAHDPSDAFAHEVEHRAYRQRLDVFVSSREAGLGIAGDHVRAGVTSETLAAAAADVVDYADAAIAIVRDEYRPRLDCRPGCSFCCRKPGVLVAVPELLRIVDHLHTQVSDEESARVRANARGYVERLAGRSFDEPTSESFPCPLLTDDGHCSVYEIRPLTCRGYNSTSVDACRRAHESVEQVVPIFVLIKDVTDGVTVGAATALRDAGSTSALVDLGSALHRAFEHGNGFAAAVVVGDEDLSAVQNSTWVDDLWAQVRRIGRDVGVDL